MDFVNRERELASLERWWKQAGAGMGIVWGRRRVGKTVLLQRFAESHDTTFHTGSGRPVADELAALSRAAVPALRASLRDVAKRPFGDWEDAIEALAEVARARKHLLVLDEFPALVESAPELPGILRATWDRVRSRTKLKLLLCGSAVRTMEAMQEERAPLYGRLDLTMALHPFDPHEAALMLPGLEPGERAIVWGLLGGMPLYLSWWDQEAGVSKNLERLACSPGGAMLNEGRLVLATEAEGGDLARRALYAIAAGRTRFNEIEQAIGTDPTRTLERLAALRLIERVAPVTARPGRTRRRSYRIADNFLSFWLGVLDRYRDQIERGLGKTILPVLVSSLDDHLGGPWEEAFRAHLRKLARDGELGDEIVAIGPHWTSGSDPMEIDAVALSGRARTAALIGEAKWARRVDARPLCRELRRKATSLPRSSPQLRLAIAARDRVEHAGDALAVTAAEIFHPRA